MSAARTLARAVVDASAVLVLLVTLASIEALSPSLPLLLAASVVAVAWLWRRAVVVGARDE